MTKREKELKAQLNAAREELRVNDLEIEDLKERLAIMTKKVLDMTPEPISRSSPFPDFDVEQVVRAI